MTHSAVKDLAQWLKSQHHGLRTHKDFQRKAIAAGKNDRDHYATYFLLAMLAERFVDAYHENPLSIAAAEEAHRRLLALTNKAADVGTMTPEQEVALLNEIAASKLF